MSEKFREKGDLLIKRIKYYKNPFDILEVEPDCTLDDVNKRYKRIAIYIHPDKRPDDADASEAFAKLKKAVTEFQKPGARQKYEELMEDATKEIIGKWTKIGKIRQPTTEFEFKYERAKLVHQRIVEIERKIKRAEKMKMANEDYERKKKEELVKQLQEDWEFEQKWNEKRDVRVNSWRQFANGGKEKVVAMPDAKIDISEVEKAVKPPKVFTRPEDFAPKIDYHANWKEEVGPRAWEMNYDHPEPVKAMPPPIAKTPEEIAARKAFKKALKKEKKRQEQEDGNMGPKAKRYKWTVDGEKVVHGNPFRPPKLKTEQRTERDPTQAPIFRY